MDQQADLSVEGRIFDIQKFSVHDGPGIRTIVFFKGCFLRCKWCSNPESQNIDIEEMNVLGNRKYIGKDMTVAKVMEEVKKDRVYYQKSGGGITLSGGEILVQPDFARELLKAAVQQGIHTAVESTGYHDFAKIKELLPWIDLFMLDIKHIDGQKHKDYTGKDNQLILANAKRISAYAKDFDLELIIRVPVIPEFNDSNSQIYEICEFVQSLPCVKEIHLLAYHAYGSGKYKDLAREYTMSHIIPPSVEKMNSLLEIPQRMGIKAQIGG